MKSGLCCHPLSTCWVSGCVCEAPASGRRGLCTNQQSVCVCVSECGTLLSCDCEACRGDHTPVHSYDSTCWLNQKLVIDTYWVRRPRLACQGGGGTSRSLAQVQVLPGSAAWIEPEPVAWWPPEQWHSWLPPGLVLQAGTAEGEEGPGCCGHVSCKPSTGTGQRWWLLSLWGKLGPRAMSIRPRAAWIPGPEAPCCLRLPLEN